MATATTVSAVLLVVLPLLALTVCLPTLKLPGMTLNRLKPILIPASCLLLASLPLIVLAVRANRARNRVFKPYLAELKRHTDQLPLSEAPKKKKDASDAEKASYKRALKLHKEEKKALEHLILKDLVKPYEAADFRFFLLTTLSKEYPKSSPKRKAIEAARNKSLNS